MKHKETVDDEAIKIASKTQRFLQKDSFPEMEDPEEFNKQKNVKTKVARRHGQKQKKEARENRKKNEGLRKALARNRKNKK